MHRAPSTVEEYQNWFSQLSEFSGIKNRGDATRNDIERFKTGLPRQGKTRPRGVGLDKVSINNVSGAGESHPRALSEPDKHVSAHPAPISRNRYGFAPKHQCGNKFGSQFATPVRTGGGKYDPEAMRFHTLYRLSDMPLSNCASDTPSTPAAPRLALTFFQASQTDRLLMPNDFCSSITLLPRSSVDAIQQHEKHGPFAPRELPRFTANTGRSAPAPGIGTLVLAGHPLGHLPLHPDDRFIAKKHENEAETLGRNYGGKEEHQYARAGDSGEGLLIAPGVGTIDATGNNTRFFGHLYFAEYQAVFDDVKTIFRKGIRADDRTDLLEAKVVKAGRYRKFKLSVLSFSVSLQLLRSYSGDCHCDQDDGALTD
jgi:hypothetical protein